MRNIVQEREHAVPPRELDYEELVTTGIEQHVFEKQAATNQSAPLEYTEGNQGLLDNLRLAVTVHKQQEGGHHALYDEEQVRQAEPKTALESAHTMFCN